PDVEVLGCRVGELAIAGEDLLRLRKWEDDQPGEYFRTHGMEGEFELGDDAEITAAAAQRPEKLRVVLLTRPKPFTARRHHFCRDEVIDGHAMLARQPAESAAERSEEHTSELQSRFDLVCRLLLEKK